MAKILLADDDDTLRKLAERALQADGHEVTVAGDGAEAAALLGAQAFDLVVSDVEMPGLGGFDLVSKFEKQLPKTKFLLISGFLERLRDDAAVASGRIATLDKPFTLDKLRAEVKRLLG